MSKKKRTTASLWADKTDRFPDDHFLRSYGWAVKGRPNTGPAVWSNGLLNLPEQQAIDHVLAFLGGNHKK